MRLFANTTLLVVLLAVFLLAGCGGGDTAKDPSQPTATIGVSLLTRTHPFYQDLEAGLQAAAQEHGYQLLIQSGEFDVARVREVERRDLVVGEAAREQEAAAVDQPRVHDGGYRCG